MEDAKVDLYAPFTTDRILEVRTGKMKNLGHLTVQSGIDKQPCRGAVFVSKMGILGDEHDPTFHGGIDKAVHGYCSTHYSAWADEFPEAAHLFVPGGFGENFVTARMNERNVCIGDVMAVGDELRLQVSLPRQPCFKLNQRFGIANFAPQTWRLSRTGWYYRVLREGHVRAGDEIRLVERGWPEWTVERVQEFLHRNQGDGAANEALAAVEPLGTESRDAFRRRGAKAARTRERQKQRERQQQQQQEEEEEEEFPDDDHHHHHQDGSGPWRDFRVVERTVLTPRVTSLVLEALTPLRDRFDYELPLSAHARLRLPGGLVRHYSVVDGDQNRFRVAVALQEHGGGHGGHNGAGSRWLHGTAREGDVVQVSRVMGAGVPAVAHASHHVFVAGGIGITAFLAMWETYHACHMNVHLHYAVRSGDETPFRDRLDRLPDRVTLYDASAGRRLDVGAVLRDRPWNSHVYVCGPPRLLDEAAARADELGIPPGDIHLETFAADLTLTGDPFEVLVSQRGSGSSSGGVGGDSGGDNLAAAKKTTTTTSLLRVGGEETLLEALQSQFDVVASSCEVGNCGTCRVRLTGGRVEHRGRALSEEDKRTWMLACVSRGVGRIEIEI